MSDHHSSLLEKIKHLPREEILSYVAAGSTITSLIDIIGIAVFTIMFFFPTVFVLGGGAICIVFLLNTHNNIRKTMIKIKEYLSKLHSIDK